MKRLYKYILTAAITSVLLLFLVQPVTVKAVKYNLSKQVANSSQRVYKNKIRIKISSRYNISLLGNSFAGEPADQVAELNSILTAAKQVKADKLLSRKAKNLAQQSLNQVTNSYYTITFAKDADVYAVTNQLKALDIVESAYGAPKPAPSPTADYSTMQTYLRSAPRGVDSTFASNFKGGDGSNVKIVDIEYSWNTNHEDLSKARGALVANGTPTDPFSNNNHGTAVLGELLADNNNYGVTGVTPGVNLELINAYNIERGYDLITALYIAALTTKPGDIIMLEQQTWGALGNGSDFVPVEYVPEYFDAIKALTDSGRLVIEPAGNGGQDLDNPIYAGTSLSITGPSSGAFIVGSADNCEGSLTLNGRVYSSTYGSRVQFYGPGNCVVTTGYGALSGTEANNYYTGSFSGTSSATPVVAATAASVQSTYKTLNSGEILNPAVMAYVLAATGSPQNTGPGTYSGHIGVYPNLNHALKITDRVAPTAPSNFNVGKLWGLPFLVWSAGTDNNKIDHYEVYRNGTYLQNSTSQFVYGFYFVDTVNLKNGTTYKYQIRAVDYSGNKSSLSAIKSLTY